MFYPILGIGGVGIFTPETDGIDDTDGVLIPETDGVLIPETDGSAGTDGTLGISGIPAALKLGMEGTLIGLGNIGVYLEKSGALAAAFNLAVFDDAILFNFLTAFIETPFTPEFIAFNT